MLNEILKKFKLHPGFKTVEELISINNKASVCGLDGSAGALFTAVILKKTYIDRVILSVFSDVEEAESFRSDMEQLIGTDLVKYFPPRDTEPYEKIDSHFEVRSQRVETLDLLERGWKGVLVTTVGAVHDPATPPGLIPLVSFEIYKGQNIPFGDFVHSLSEKGFSRKNTVTSPGQIAVRGGIIDIYPFGGEIPYRIEFWGDEVESIRSFSTSTQRFDR